jgi:hypothetical protein
MRFVTSVHPFQNITGGEEIRIRVNRGKIVFDQVKYTRVNRSSCTKQYRPFSAIYYNTKVFVYPE